MTCDHKPFRGTCPYCKVTTRHRWVGSDQYLCPVCKKMHGWDEITPREEPKIEAPAQGRLFE